MEYFEIKGGSIAKGEITPSGNKNEALPVLAASLLADEKVCIQNLPDILDVQVTLDIMENIGVKINRIDSSTVEIDPTEIKDQKLDPELCRKIRASILFAGPLLAKFGAVELPLPGGDVIGRRRVDTHFLGFGELGAAYTVSSSGYRVSANELNGADIFLDEKSVTGTENIIMAAVLAKGKTIVDNAATEPHVQRLCFFLNKMGAKIEGIGTSRIIIEGVEKLHGTEHKIGPDYLETGSFIVLAAVTGGEILIKDAAPAELKMILHTFRKIGIETEVRGNDVFVPHHSRFSVKKDLNNAVPKIDDSPWPAFPTDLMSIAIVAATHSDGTLLFFEKMFDGRMFFVDNLIAMGASIIICDPHRVVVSGPCQLYGGQFESPDIRAGMALLIAAAAAKGTSRIYNVRQIDRGYERIDEKFQALGIDIERKES